MYRYINNQRVWVDPHNTPKTRRTTPIEPNQSLSIKEIYNNWRIGKPTSVHILPLLFDEEEGAFGEEPPIDISQVHNRIDDLKKQQDQDKKDKKAHQKTKQLVDKLNNALDVSVRSQDKNPES